MQITPPFGYKEVLPLQKTQKVRLLKAGEIPEFAKKLNAIPISYTEFALVSRDYPIVFTSGDEGKRREGRHPQAAEPDRPRAADAPTHTAE